MIKVDKINVEETYPLRIEVLRKGMTLSHEMAGDMDPDAFHLGLFKDGQLHCIASFMPNQHPDFKGKHYQLRGMATAESARGKGFGRRILEEAMKELRSREVDLLWCNARVVALDFYRKLGFETFGEAFEVPQVGPHFMMFRGL